MRERLWAVVDRVCGTGYTEPTANFYELGGDSLLAGELMSALRAEFGTELPMNLLFEAPDMGTFVKDAVALVDSSTQRGGS
ncbi:acyl carrier protein [Nocardia sp. NPDC051052]|uniref:acyl carrier protein n=1 Tax=Nocardia sp. NPDC051052 TaxID=3364322 RepID=UPI0037A011D6